MGDMTLTDFRADVTSAVARGTIGTGNLDRWINQGLWEFAHAFKFKELQKVVTYTLIQGINTLVLPADFRALNDEGGIVITSPESRLGELTPETRRSYLKNINLLNAGFQTAAARYHTYGKAIYIRPVPDSTSTDVQLHYWGKAAKFTTALQVSEFDEDWDDVIFTGALYRAYRWFGEFNRYQNVRNDFLGMVRSRIMDEDLEPFPEGGISLAQSEDRPNGYS